MERVDEEETLPIILTVNEVRKIDIIKITYFFKGWA
jgi:hypothetical protein